MPQLDPSSFPSQLFWLTISFITLYILLARFLLPRVQSVIEVRTQTVKSDITQADDMRTQAQQVRDVYEKSLADTRAKSKAMIDEARAKMAEIAAEKQASMHAELEKQVAGSEAGIEKAKQDVMGKLLPVASELVGNIVNMLIEHKLDSSEIDAAVSKFGKGGIL
jgi:F-type H+-transporting ATPase subunit b